MHHRRLIAFFAIFLIHQAGAGPAAAETSRSPGPQARPPGPSRPTRPPLPTDDARRRTVRGCPVGYDCHSRLSEDLRIFEEHTFGRKSSPWIESRAPGSGTRTFRRAQDPTALRPDLPWLANLRLPDLPVVWDERVIAYLEFYKNDPRGRRIMASWLEAQGKYRRLITKILSDAGLPHDLIYVAMIESAYDATDYSRSGASGLWQFMPGGGRIYGLTVNRWLDERNDPVQSTKAAAMYLRDLYQRFGSWHLALAAYNCGYGAVLQSMAKYNTNDFWKLLDWENALPWGSSIYVPKALAAAIVGNNRAAFGFENLTEEAEVEWDDVEVTRSVPLSAIAKAAGVSREDVERLNPQLRRGRTPPGRDHYVVRIPRGTANTFAQRFPQLRGDWDDTDAYVVSHGERFEDIATRFGISRAKLAEMNGIETEAEVHGGMVLVVPRVAEAVREKNQTEADDNLYSSGEPEGESGDKLLVAIPDAGFAVPGKKRVFYRVVSGDSQTSIADAFGIDRADLARWNGLDPEAHLQARMVMQVWIDEDFPLAKRGIKVLDPARLVVVQSGSPEHLNYCEEIVGRKRVVYTASKRETFEDIGKRYGLSAYDLARINRMSPSTVLEKDQQIVVYEVDDPSASDRAREQHDKARRSRRKSRRSNGKKPAPSRAKEPAPSHEKKPEPSHEKSSNNDHAPKRTPGGPRVAQARPPAAPAAHPAKPTAPAAPTRAAAPAAPPPDGPKAEASP